MWTVVALFSLVVLHVPIKPYDLVINHKHTHTYISPKVIMTNIHHIVKDSFKPSQVYQLSISTQNIYLKGLSKVKGIKSSHVLKKVISHQIYEIQHLKVNLVIRQVVWDKIE
jgi:hypothetical protein